MSVKSEEMVESVEELNESINSSKLNESVNSVDIKSEPELKSDLNTSLDSSLNGSQNIGPNISQTNAEMSGKKRKLTKNERIRLQMEREEKRKLREKDLEDKRLERERKAKELVEKKLLVEREREERNKLKELEKNKKIKDKELKDKEKMEKQCAQIEKRRKLEEEKQKKLSEKMKAEEEEKRRLEKSRDVLNRFIKKGSDDPALRPKTFSLAKDASKGHFLPFQLSANQTMAPIVNQTVKERFVLGAFDSIIQNQDSQHLYLDIFRDGFHQPFRYVKSRSDPEIIIEEIDEKPNQRKFYKTKHLQFHQNVRPPYRGTWSKSSDVIHGRKPFIKDKQFFDYEVDSDQEWEEGGPGESLDGSDSDGSVKDDYEIDNDFFVPHGYLSPDENEIEEQVVDGVDHKDDDSDANEVKSGPLLKEQVLMAERNRAFAKSLVPIVIGCIWESNNEDNNHKHIKSLNQFRRVPLLSK